MSAIHGQLQVSLLHVERSSYRSLRLVENTHSTWALSYVAEGSVVTECRGYRWPVEVGDIMIHPPGVAYSELAAGPGMHEWMLLEATLPPKVDLLRLYPVAPVVRIESRREFAEAFQALYELWRAEESAFRELSMLAQSARLLSLLLDSWQKAGAIPRPLAMQSAEDRFAGVLNYIKDHLGEKLTREALAGLMGFHPVYFDRLFRQTYGQAPMQMVRGLRLERAKALLEGSAQSIEWIAHRCGFPSSAAFIRLFQEKYQQTPGEYRQSLKTAKERYKAFL